MYYFIIYKYIDLYYPLVCTTQNTHLLRRNTLLLIIYESQVDKVYPLAYNQIS